MIDADRVFDERIAADRRRVLARCRGTDRAKVETALDRLIAFSRLHMDVLEPIDTSALDQPCIGFKLRLRDQVLWKVYAERNTLEVLIRGGKSLSDSEYDEFLAVWRLIPGQQKKPESREKIPMMNVGAVANDLVWRGLEVTMKWAVALPAKS